MTWCSDDSATPRFVLASSAIRCRFVDRFVSLRVLSRVSRHGSLLMAPLFPRSGPGESGSPTSAVILRWYDFLTRIPGHLFVSLPGSTLSFSVRFSQLASRSRKVGGGLPGQVHCSTDDPKCRLALAWA